MKKWRDNVVQRVYQLLGRQVEVERVVEYFFIVWSYLLKWWFSEKLCLLYTKSALHLPFCTLQKILNYLFPAARRKKVPVVSRSLNIFPFRHKVTLFDPTKFLEGKNCETPAQGSVTNPSHSPHPPKCKKTVQQFKFLRLFFSLLGVSLCAVPNSHRHIRRNAKQTV